MLLKIVIYAVYMLCMRMKSLPYYIIKKTSGEDKALDYVFKSYEKWATFTINIIGIEIDVVGAENIPDGACVFIGNHTSILDIPILMKATQRKLGFISKKEVLKAPVIGYWLRRGKNVALDRENPREGIRAINEGVENIKSGFSMVIFPEGTRSKDGTINDFKKGSFKLATKSKSPIVPLYIDGAYRCYEEEKKFVPRKIRVVFGNPILTSSLEKAEEKELPNVVREGIILMQNSNKN